jgi:C1A family cysteine protease
MARTNFEKLNALIKKSGAEWTAGETTYSGYAAVASNSKLLGLAMTPEQAFGSLSAARSDEQQVLFGAAPPVTPPPPQLDWRDHKGKNWVTAIRDQKTCGSCVSFATCGSLEARLLIANNKPGVAIDLSEAHLFYCGTPNSCDTGWQPAKAMAFAKKNGIGLEKDFPYKPGNQACKIIKPAVRVTGHHEVGTSVGRKKALLEGPVVAAMAVYSDFFHYKSGVYRHVSGSLVGYHAVCVIGFDDKAGCWLIKNSWGPGWGDKGFFRLRYGECGTDTQFPFTVPDAVVVESGVSIF